MVHVKIVCSKSELNFEGEWHKNESTGTILDEMKKEAQYNGIPVMITIKDHGTFSITPSGQVMRGSLYDIDKLKKLNHAKRHTSK